MGYHKRKISRGTYGELSKIKEELEEAYDAEEQGQDLMLMIELSDMIGAIEGVGKKYGLTLEQLIAFARLRSQVAIEEEQQKEIGSITKSKRKHYKNFTMITISYRCDKGCPYCIARIDKLPNIPENISLFEKTIKILKEKGYSFDYFVLSGNGEPSMYSYETLSRIRDVVEKSGMFKEKRIQTSGNLFHEDKKFNLFKDWIIEITRVSENNLLDSTILKYKGDYTKTDTYKNAKLRVNLVALNSNLQDLPKMVRRYVEKHNVNIVGIKILDNKDNEWITYNAVGYDKVSDILDIFEKDFMTRPRKEYNSYVWHYWSGESQCWKQVTMSVNDEYLEKDEESLYWYGDKFLDRKGE